MNAHNWLILRINRETVERYAPCCHGDLLDIGCGEKPHETILRQYVRSYTGLDHEHTLHDARADVWGDASDLPFADASFNTVVMFQTLEHIPEPARALSEAFRVLRPSGTILITTPFMWGLHERPYDFYRYTPFALEYLLRRAGFVDMNVEQVGGYWLTAGLRFSYYLRKYGWRWRRYPVMTLQLATQLIASFLNRIDSDEIDATGYTTIARRP
jgi:SAM-dependent methyltransferase